MTQPTFTVKALNPTKAMWIGLTSCSDPQKAREWFDREKDAFIRGGYSDFILVRSDEEKFGWPRQLVNKDGTTVCTNGNWELLEKTRKTLTDEMLFEVVYPEGPEEKGDFFIKALHSRSRDKPEKWVNMACSVTLEGAEKVFKANVDEWSNSGWTSFTLFPKNWESIPSFSLKRDGKEWTKFIPPEDIVSERRRKASSELWELAPLAPGTYVQTTPKIYREYISLLNLCKTDEQFERLRMLLGKLVQLTDVNRRLKEQHEILLTLHEDIEECHQEIVKNSSSGSASPDS